MNEAWNSRCLGWGIVDRRAAEGLGPLLDGHSPPISTKAQRHELRLPVDSRQKVQLEGINAAGAAGIALLAAGDPAVDQSKGDRLESRGIDAHAAGGGVPEGIVRGTAGGMTGDGYYVPRRSLVHPRVR